jgi:hypothetical protein
MQFRTPLKLVAAIIATSIISVFETKPTFASPINQATSNQSDLLRLVGVRASEITIGARDVRYTFTINIPKSSQPIEKVQISQLGGLEVIKFDQSKIRASGSLEEQKKLTVSQVDVDSKTQGVIITFDPPVQSGQVLRVSVGVKQNPLTDGNYLFNTVVYPQGRPDAISLGVGRIRITSIHDTE